MDRNEMIVEQRHLLWCRCLKYLEPSGERSSFYGWFFPVAALNPVEEDIRWFREIVQLNSGAECSRLEPQMISFGPAPCAPFEDDDKPEGK